MHIWPTKNKAEEDKRVSSWEYRRPKCIDRIGKNGRIGLDYQADTGDLLA
jgi:hypothetical protein